MIESNELIEEIDLNEGQKEKVLLRKLRSRKLRRRRKTSKSKHLKKSLALFKF